MFLSKMYSGDIAVRDFLLNSHISVACSERLL